MDLQAVSNSTVYIPLFSNSTKNQDCNKEMHPSNIHVYIAQLIVVNMCIFPHVQEVYFIYVELLKLQNTISSSPVDKKCGNATITSITAICLKSMFYCLSPSLT